LGIVESGGGFVSNEDVPLKIVGLNILEECEHLLRGVGFEFQGIDDVLYLVLVLLFGFNEFFFEKSKNSIHFNIIKSHQTLLSMAEQS
jgi:hypothetical protein